MDKEQVDKIIAEYMEKIFGFALTKTMNTDKAEELASRITFDVYLSLLKIDMVHNINGYIYRVARNVYARFVDEEVRGRYVSLDEVSLPCEEDFTINFEKDETYIRLRREASYLGQTQREIVVMHYFQKLKLSEIGKRLQIPLGTVKWHLHKAKNQLEEGINTMREKGTLGLAPVRFNHMGHSGNTGPEGRDTSNYLEKLISQNIAYAAYHDAKTITEIAGELGVPAAFVEDEVASLEDNGFMDQVAGGKYLTNIYIYHLTKESAERRHEQYQKYTKLACEQYVPLIFDCMKEYKAKQLYTPEDDFNFLMWTAITYAFRNKFFFKKGADESKYRVKRKDGGDYIANATIIDDFKVDFDINLYNTFGNMNRWGDDYPVFSWQVNSFYDTRGVNWRDNLYDDYCWLYDFMTGKLTKEPDHADQFKRLYDKGYIAAKGDSEYVNMIVTTLTNEELVESLPAVPDVLKTASDELDRAIYAIEKALYPPHMQPLCRSYCSNCLGDQQFVAYVLKQLLDDGTLKPLTDTQKHSVNTIMFCDVLPQ